MRGGSDISFVEYVNYVYFTDSVLEEKDVYKEEYEEALTLLRDMKKKYKMVHVKTVEQATHIESETNNQMSQIEN